MTQPTRKSTRIAHLILYHHAGCGLCDRLEALVRPRLAGLQTAFCGEITFSRSDIADEPYRREQFATRIPVLTCNGKVILEGRPAPEEVDQALKQLLTDTTTHR